MLKLYHYPLCAKSRLVRVILKEFNINFELKKIEPWGDQKNIKGINPSGLLPILLLPTSSKICEIYPLIEYLIEIEPNSHFTPQGIEDKAEMRRLINWCFLKFDQDVSSYFLSEKLYKIMDSSKGAPRTDFLRAARINFSYHIDYFISLISARSNLVYDQLTIADIALACQLSVLDYLNEVDWDNNGALKEWYMPIKSRPAFRDILSDKVPIVKPPAHYHELDF